MQSESVVKEDGKAYVGVQVVHASPSAETCGVDTCSSLSLATRGKKFFPKNSRGFSDGLSHSMHLTKNLRNKRKCH